MKISVSVLLTIVAKNLRHMPHLKISSKKLSLALVFLLHFSTISYAQPTSYTTPVNSQVTRSNSAGILGIDVLTISSETVKVYSIPGGVAWDYFDGVNHLTGTGDRGVDATASDIVLVYSSGVFYALEVLYNDFYTKPYIYIWEFDPTGYGALNVSSQYPVSSNIGVYSYPWYRIRIDANSANQFAIVWEDENGEVYINAGEFSAGSISWVVSSPVGTSITTGQHPDVAITEAQSGTSAIMYIAYLADKSLNDLRVDRFDITFGGSPAINAAGGMYPTSIDSDPNDEAIPHVPFIACPNTSDEDTWTVVYLKSNGTVHDVFGYTLYQGSSTHGVVNYTLYADTDDDRLPTVSYNNETTSANIGFQVAWTAIASGSPYSYSTTIMSFACDNDGDVLSYTGNDFLIVPDYYYSSAQDISPLAGRHSPHMEVCYWGGELYSKEFDWNNTFRKRPAIITKAEGTPVAEISIGLYGNSISNSSFDLSILNSNSNYSLLITDISGRSVFKSYGDVFSLEERLVNNFRRVNSGTYIVSFFDKSRLTFSMKVVRL